MEKLTKEEFNFISEILDDEVESVTNGEKHYGDFTQVQKLDRCDAISSIRSKIDQLYFD